MKLVDHQLCLVSPWGPENSREPLGELTPDQAQLVSVAPRYRLSNRFLVSLVGICSIGLSGQGWRG